MHVKVLPAIKQTLIKNLWWAGVTTFIFVNGGAGGKIDVKKSQIVTVVSVAQFRLLT